MTMTVTVMVMETTGALQLIVPLMLTVFFAKVRLREQGRLASIVPVGLIVGADVSLLRVLRRVSAVVFLGWSPHNSPRLVAPQLPSAGCPDSSQPAPPSPPAPPVCPAASGRTCPAPRTVY